MTSSLLKDLKNGKAQKGNVMRATVEMEQSALRYAKIHFQNLNASQWMKKSDGLRKLRMLQYVYIHVFLFERVFN